MLSITVSHSCLRLKELEFLKKDINFIELSKSKGRQLITEFKSYKTQVQDKFRHSLPIEDLDGYSNLTSNLILEVVM